MQPQQNEKEKDESSLDAKPDFWRSLGKDQKIALGALAAFVLLMVIAWSIQFKRSLTEPFAYKGDNSVAGDTASSTDNEAALKSKDTDGDGLSDWDELNIYHTSPYLEDTDGDGIPDGVEIKNGTDPNCPEGKSCFKENQAAVSGGTGSSSDMNGRNYLDVLNQLNALENSQNSAASNVSSSPDKLLGGGYSAAELRQSLLASGMDEKTLSQFSDDEIIKIYKDSIKQNNK